MVACNWPACFILAAQLDEMHKFAHICHNNHLMNLLVTCELCVVKWEPLSSNIIMHEPTTSRTTNQASTTTWWQVTPWHAKDDPNMLTSHKKWHLDYRFSLVCLVSYGAFNLFLPWNVVKLWDFPPPPKIPL